MAKVKKRPAKKKLSTDELIVRAEKILIQKGHKKITEEEFDDSLLKIIVGKKRIDD